MKNLIFLCFCLLLNFGFPQPGARDYSFAFSDTIYDNNYSYYSVQKQYNNKILYCVKNEFIREVYLKRYYDNGLEDHTFNEILVCNPGISINWPSYIWSNDFEVKYKVLPNNKIIVSIYDYFTNEKKVVRLTENGEIDLTFNEYIVTNFVNSITIKNIEVDNHGNIYVFSTGSVVKLFPNGQIDYTFSQNFQNFSGNYLNNFGVISGIKINSDNSFFLRHQGQVGDSDLHLFKLDTLGNLLNYYDLVSNGLIEINIQDIATQSDGKILLGGNFSHFNGDTLYSGLIRLNTDGTWDQSFPIFERNTSIWFFSKVNLAILNNDKIVLSHYRNYDDSIGIVLFHKDGQIDTNTNFYEKCIKVTSILLDEHKLYFTTNYTNQKKQGLFRIRLKEFVLGDVFADFNTNCINENNEIKLSNKKLTLQPGNTIIQTFDDGRWHIDYLPAGNYTVTIDTSNINWTVTCPITQSFTVIHSDSLTIAPSFGLVSNNPCPSPTVSVNMPRMRPCFTNQQVYVQACNVYDATGILPDAYSIIELDPALIFESASLPYTSLGNNQYRFEHDTLYPGECVNYTISTQVDCNAPLGLTLCLEAHLYPVADCVLDTLPTPPTGEVTPCTLPWDQSSLSVEGWCANDSIYFTIINTGQLGGGDMECYSPVRIFIDGVPYLLDSIQLLGGETFTYVFAGNGATWILEADQHPLHPGNSHPNVHVENCNPGNWTPNIVNDFPQDDADPVKDIYCGVVTGSHDPNDKKGTPYGLGAEHEVLPNQDIEYLIRFQNTGTDTAFAVVVRDTLDLDFDIFSVTSGSASHNYTFRMYGPRVMEWTFSNILLPDSTTNEEASHGFLSYRVKQKPNLADGTLLTNDADIYFDFNAPIITNETSHKVQRRTFEPTNSLVSLSQTKTGIKVFPNPTKAQTTLSFITYQKQITYQLMNISGQVLLEKSNVSGKDITINLAQLPDGIYFVKVETSMGTEILKVVKE